MRSIIFISTSLIFLILLTGCPNSKFKHQKAWFPETVTNLTEVNSEYDDYNSALPEVHFGKKLIFSSNRRSQGDNFDIYDGNFHAIWYMETGTLQVDDVSNGWIDYSYHSDKLLKAIDNTGNQFAPYAIGFDTMIDGHRNRIDFLAYSTSNGSNSFHSEFVYYITPDEGVTFEVKGPFPVSFMMDSMHQQYISFYSPDIISVDDRELNPDDFTELYFDQTVENGQSDIYSLSIPDSLDFLSFLSFAGNIFEKRSMDILNSSSNDRCPYVNGQFMVFASDRPGGFGGYDLYYSNFENGQWSEPVNFGEKVNSEYDEFRPVVVQVYEFQNDLMIFSSNRPGGLGGFDLYYAGIKKIVPIIYN